MQFLKRIAVVSKINISGKLYNNIKLFLGILVIEM